MQKKYSVLTITDFPTPSYLRPYRNVLFIDFAPKGYFKDVYIISPCPKDKFQNTEVAVRPFYFNAGDFKKNQYKLLYRIRNMLMIFVYLMKFRLTHLKKIDFVRTGTTYLSFFIALTLNKKTPFFADICDFYSDLYEEFGMPMGRYVKKIIFRIEASALKRPNLIFLDTIAQREYVTNTFGVSKKKCVVIPNGLLMDYYPLKMEKDKQVLKKYNFSANDKILFYGGDLSRLDGVELIIEYVKKHRNIKALIIGKGNPEYINSLKAKVQKEKLDGNIIFDTFKPPNEAYKYISVADVCLAPFKITKTSNTVECAKIISALMMGKLVLATEADGVRSLYKDSIKYFKDGDFISFASQLDKLLNRKLNRGDKLKIRRVGERFDFKKILQHEYKVIEQYFKDPTQDFSQYDYI
jgi:glycosyltransferase involved in cell wall biosynthesis